MMSTECWQIRKLSRQIVVLICIAMLQLDAPIARSAPVRSVVQGKLHHKRIATIKMLRRQVKLGMTLAAVNRAVRDLSFLRGGQTFYKTQPEGAMHEEDGFVCSDGTVWVGYAVVGYGGNIQAAKVISIAGQHFHEGVIDDLP